MKKVCLLLSILALTLTVGAQKPVPMAAYLSLSAGTWNPWTSSGGFGSLSFTPPAIGLYCQATSGGPWQPCNPGSGSGGNATSLQGNPVSATAPTPGQVYVENPSKVLTPETITGTFNWPYQPLADYDTRNVVGTTLIDSSGNGYDGTLGGGSATLPTVTPQGLSFNTNLTTGVYDNTRGDGVLLPSAVNAAQSCAFSFYDNIPPTISGGIAFPAFGTFLTSSNVGSGFNILNWLHPVGGGSASGSFGIGIYANNANGTQGVNSTSGFHTAIVTIGSGVGTGLTHIYIDGQETGYTNQTTDGGYAPAGGNFYLGSVNSGVFANNSLFGMLPRATLFSQQLTPSQAQAVDSILRSDALARGIQISPINIRQAVPTINCVGDSITYGLGVTTPYCTSFSLDAGQPVYTTRILGVVGITLWQIAAMEPDRMATYCKGDYGPVWLILDAATNDLYYGSYGTIANIQSNMAGVISKYTNAGCKVLVADMISRTGNSNATGNPTMDSLKNSWDAIVADNWKAWGAAGEVVFSSNPLLGADGAYSGSDFLSDGTHPNQTGQNAMNAEAVAEMNYLGGQNAGNPNLITATTATLLNSQVFNLVTPATNTAITMPTCYGLQGGATYTINVTNSNAVTVVEGVSGQTINGSASAVTLPTGPHVTNLIVTQLSKTTAGCIWSF